LNHKNVSKKLKPIGIQETAATANVVCFPLLSSQLIPRQQAGSSTLFFGGLFEPQKFQPKLG
jgi:hypothetical protein